MDYFNKGESNIFKLDIDPGTKNDFHEMARWTKFLGIIGFICMSLILLVGFYWGLNIRTFAETYGGPSAQAIMNNPGLFSGVIIALVLIMVGIYFYPTYALVKYASCMKQALASDSKDLFNRAIRYLKNMFKYMGILMIIVLGIYGLEIIFGIIAVMNR